MPPSPAAKCLLPLVAALLWAPAAAGAALPPSGAVYWGQRPPWALGKVVVDFLPTPVPGDVRLREGSIVTGLDFACGVDEANQAYCFGEGGGQGRVRAEALLGQAPCRRLRGGGPRRLHSHCQPNTHASALQKRAGDNAVGQLGAGLSAEELPASQLPVAVASGGTRYSQIAAAQWLRWACAIREEDLGVDCWGERWGAGGAGGAGK